MKIKINNSYLSELRKLQVARSYAAILITWLTMALLVFFVSLSEGSTLFWVIWPFSAFLMAGRQGALLNLVHEGSHRLLHPIKAKNDLLSDWFCAYPIGLTTISYKKVHEEHHRYAATKNEPISDFDKYSEVDWGSSRIYIKFAQDFFCISALRSFLSYKEKSNNRSDLLKIALMQLIVLVAVFQLNFFLYAILWIFPLIGPHMVLMRFRGIAEHGYHLQKKIIVENPEQGVLFTRSMGTNANKYKNVLLCLLEKILIGSININYHHEHHLFPSVPFYNLPKLHDLVAQQVRERNSDAYAKGYFYAALCTSKT